MHVIVIGTDIYQVNGLVIVNKLPSVLVNNRVPLVSTATIKVSSKPQLMLRVTLVLHLVCRK